MLGDVYAVIAVIFESIHLFYNYIICIFQIYEFKIDLRLFGEAYGLVICEVSIVSDLNDTLVLIILSVVGVVSAVCGLIICRSVVLISIESLIGVDGNSISGLYFGNAVLNCIIFACCKATE